MKLDSHTERQMRLLAESRNRDVLTILEEDGESLHVEELADRVLSREVAVVSSARYDELLEGVLLSLHHEVLPRLDEGGLIEYDPETNMATSRTASGSTVEKGSDTVVDALVASLPTSPEDGDERVGTLDGREAAIRYGRRLADEAEDELFCMYVSTDLLEDECIQRAEDAAERGVAVFMGSQNAEVRDLTRKHLSEATIWEPQLDWLNTPAYPRVGRLVLADRRKVMLAILDGPSTDDATPEESALVGEGKDNPLVVLVRDLLGSRLDHLDHQSAEFKNGLLS